MDQKETFEKAVATSKTLTARPDNETLLRLYSLYKQATEGDVNIDSPNMFDFVAKAKYDAWVKLKGLSASEAKQQYVNLVAQLAGKND